MKMKYLAWLFVPAMALGLAACDNAGDQSAGTTDPGATSSSSGMGTDPAAPMAAPGSGSASSGSSEDTTTAAPIGGGSSG